LGVVGVETRAAGELMGAGEKRVGTQLEYPELMQAAVQLSTEGIG